MSRLRFTIEFSKNKEKELMLYQELLKYSSPQSIIKDMLLGVIALPEIGDNDTTKASK